MIRRLVLAIALAVMGLGAVQHSGAHAASGTVLILGSTVSGGTDSLEAQAAESLGYSVQVVSDAQWDSMTQAQFASYSALILGDPVCEEVEGSDAAAIANASTWASAATGNVVVIGGDPSFHASEGNPDAYDTIVQGIKWAASSSSTGAYITLSCYYAEAPPNTPAPELSGFGTFTVQGRSDNCVTVVGTGPDLTSGELTGWGTSMHEAFDSYPSTFSVFATGTTCEGSASIPVILVRPGGYAAGANATVSAWGGPSCTMVNMFVKAASASSSSGTLTYRDDRASACSQYRSGAVSITSRTMTSMVCQSAHSATASGTATYRVYPNAATTVTVTAVVTLGSTSGSGTITITASNGYSSGTLPIRGIVSGC